MLRMLLSADPARRASQLHSNTYITLLMDFTVGMQQSRMKGVAMILPITLSTVYILAAQGRLSA